MPSGLTPEAWLELGVTGAALFIILVVIVLMFQLQSKNVDKLCNKIDEIVTSFSENNLKLNEVIISNDKDQKETIRMLSNISETVHSTHELVAKLNTTVHSINYRGD